MPKINPIVAKKFLERFNYELITIATIPEPNAPIRGFDLPHFKSTKYSKQGKPKVAHSLTLEEMDHEFFLELAELQRFRRAVYFLVNESNGITSDAQPNASRNENIINLSACFCDTDNCDPNNVIAFINKCGIKPHIAVQTSPKKFHFYFLLEPTSIADKPKWQAIQRCFGWLGDLSQDFGMDKTMHDITQLMRVPGFLHQKKEPFQIEIIKQNYHQLYTLDELFIKTGASEFFKSSKDYSTYSYPNYKISAGERHEAFRNYALSVANDFQGDSLSLEKTLDAVDGFILKNFENPHAFLLGGSRRKEVLRTVKDAVNLANKALLAVVPTILDSVEEREDNAFALADSFFFHCPGIVGDMVKHTTLNSRYPVPSFAFAAAAALLGTLKAPYITSELGHAPTNYFLCLAPTGAGKSYPQEVNNHALNALGIPDVAASKIRSARGIELFLEKHNSNGLLDLDEAEGLLASLNEKNTPHHIKIVKDLLLELYSKTNIPNFSTGYTGDKKIKPTILHYPRLNLIAYGVIHTLSEAFTTKSIQDGLLQRFIVFTHMVKRVRNPEFKPAETFPPNVMQELRELLTESRIITLEDEDTLHKLKLEVASEEKPEKKKLLIAKIDNLLKKRSNASKRVITFKTDALELLDKFTDKLDDLASRELDKDRGFEGLYTRGAEQVGRLATTLTQESYIDKHLVEYCIEIVESRVTALREYAWKNLGISEFKVTENKLYKYILKNCVKSKGPVSYRTIARNFTGVKYRRHLREVLDGLLDDGRLTRVSPISRGGRGKLGESFVPADFLEQEDL